MPSSIDALLIIIFAVVPGLPGEKLYRDILGIDQRESNWDRVTRVITISLVGFALYASIGWVFNLPVYNYPEPFPDDLARSLYVRSTALAFVGHASAAFLVGVGAGFSVRLLNRSLASTAARDTWPHFLRIDAAGHYVLATLKNTECFRGILYMADASVEAEERDIVLQDPALFELTKGTYEPLPYKHIFLPGRMISTIATLYDPAIDSRSDEEEALFLHATYFGSEEDEKGVRNG